MAMSAESAPSPTVAIVRSTVAESQDVALALPSCSSPVGELLRAPSITAPELPENVVPAPAAAFDQRPRGVLCVPHI